jgi:hypothetical protein
VPHRGERAREGARQRLLHLRLLEPMRSSPLPSSSFTAYCASGGASPSSRARTRSRFACVPRVAASASNAAASSPSVRPLASGATPPSSSRAASPSSPRASDRSRHVSRGTPLSRTSASATVAPPTLVVRMSCRGKTSPEKKRAAMASAASSSVAK